MVFPRAVGLSLVAIRSMGNRSLADTCSSGASPGHNIAPRTIPEGALAPETSLLGHYSSGGKRFLLEISADPFCSPNYPPIRQPNGMWKNANLIGPRDTLEYALTTWRVSVALVAADL